MLQKNVNEHVTAQFGQLSLKVDEINKNLAKSEQAKIDKNVQAARGADFEDLLYEEVAKMAHLKSDIVDNPGKQKMPGLSGNHEGDITVEVSSKDTHGETVRFVWEGKLRAGTLSPKKCIEELEKGMSNRDSRVGIIAVEKFSGMSTETGDVFRELKENMAVLVLDPNNIDFNAVRLAYLWARWRCLLDVGNVLDTSLVTQAIKEISQSISSFKTLRSKNTQVVKLIGENEDLLSVIESQIKDKLTALSQAIDEVNQAEAEETE